MSYSSLIKRNVSKAFRLVGDLCVTVSLTRKSSVGFDFAANAPKTVTTTAKPISAIFVSKRVTSDNKLTSTVQNSFLFKSEELPDPSVYDTITVTRGNIAAIGTWNMVPPFLNDGYLVTVNCARV